eukprot:TRINITY_DN13324_c0_g1_i2.p1 TRINITY_DN13324_c0_g1~~TRINITY_DN13324_c0_g1_i2.p1  ORF type:complete len:252 (-),score=41.21 TRINITY_DN13324_c0_g1_i2:100-834(-)
MGEDLLLDDYHACALLNILWLLLRTNNPEYRSTTTQKTTLETVRSENFDTHPVDTNTEAHRSDVKTMQSDFAVFQRALLNHSTDNPPHQLRLFKPNEVKKILDYVKDVYFAHYNLYQYVFTNKQKNEEIKVIVSVDVPMSFPPLSEALFMGKTQQEVHLEDEEEHVPSPSRRLNRGRDSDFDYGREDFQHQETQGIPAIDEKTMEMISTKLKQAEDSAQKLLEERQKHLQDKLDTLVPPAKGKK